MDVNLLHHPLAAALTVGRSRLASTMQRPSKTAMLNLVPPMSIASVSREGGAQQLFR